MAKRLKWGTFSIDDLLVDSEDDIFLDFPFLDLVKMGNEQHKRIRGW